MDDSMVTVKDLIKILSLQDPETIVALSSDSEGNSFTTMHKNGCIMTDVYLENQFGGQDDYVCETDYLNSKHDTIKPHMVIYTTTRIKLKPKFYSSATKTE